MNISRPAILVVLGLSGVLALSACNRGEQVARSQSGQDGNGHRGRGMDFSDVKFPIAKADFIARMSTRMRQRCAKQDPSTAHQGRGIDCSTLEAGIARCATAAAIPDSIADRDAARDAARGYFQCVRQQ